MVTRAAKLSHALIVSIAIAVLGFGFLWVGCAKEPQEVVTPSVQQQGGALSKTAQLQTVMAVQNRHTDRLLELPGVRGVGIGADGEELVLHVFVNPRAGRPDNVPRRIEGLRVKVIETDDFVALDGPPGDNHRTQLSTPVPAGVSTSNDNGCYAGTRGFLAYKSGQVGYITNNHVAAAGGKSLCPGKASIGEPQYHVGTYDNGCLTAGTVQIGTLHSFVKLEKGKNNKVDAAFVASSTSLITAEIMDIGTPTTTAVNPVLNMTVRKSGRTTGFTSGTITTVNATVLVNYGSSCGIYKFVGQFIIGNQPGFSAAGDSGSPVVDGSNNPVGLLFAGSSTSTICNRITDVLTGLGLNF